MTAIELGVRMPKRVAWVVCTVLFLFLFRSLFFSDLGIVVYELLLMGLCVALWAAYRCIDWFWPANPKR